VAPLPLSQIGPEPMGKAPGWARLAMRSMPESICVTPVRLLVLSVLEKIAIPGPILVSW